MRESVRASTRTSMRARPVVGIAGARYTVARPYGELTVHGVPQRYVDHVVAAGGCPVVLPPSAGHDGIEVINVLDGLVLAGGGDLDPALYDRADVQAARDVDRARDEAEIALVRRARTTGVPVLGVCRGAQVMAVAAGGTLVPDLGEDLPHVIIGGFHPIETCTGSRVASILDGTTRVNSLHHQAIDDPGCLWRVTARAHDGVVEAIEWDRPRRWPAIGVQWHPELDHTGPALFGWLVQVAGEHSASGRDVIRGGGLDDQLV